MTNSNDSPDQHHSTDVERRSNMLQKEIAGYLQQNVENEEREEYDVEIVAGHIEVSLEPLYACVTDVDASLRSVHIKASTCRNPTDR